MNKEDSDGVVLKEGKEVKVFLKLDDLKSHITITNMKIKIQNNDLACEPNYNMHSKILNSYISTFSQSEYNH